MEMCVAMVSLLHPRISQEWDRVSLNQFGGKRLPIAFHRSQTNNECSCIPHESLNTLAIQVSYVIFSQSWNGVAYYL